VQMDLTFSADRTLATLDKMAAAAATLLEVAGPAIVGDFHRMEAARFDANGPGWDPLTPATIAIKTARGMPQPERILYGQGDLLNSLTGHTEHTVVDIKPDELFVGTNVPYAQYHQSGPRVIKVFGKGDAKLPERILVQVREEDAARWGAILSAGLRSTTTIVAEAGV